MITSRIDLGHLRKLYALANTPTWLFNQIRDMPSVQAVGKASSIEEIETALLDLSLSPISDANKLATIYGIIVALSFKPRSDISALLDRIQFDIPWGEQLKAFVLGRSDQANESRSEFDLHRYEKDPVKSDAISSAVVIKL